MARRMSASNSRATCGSSFVGFVACARGSAELPEGVTAEIDKQTAITLRAADKALLGETAAKLRALRKPDPYKGKGIRYEGEYVRRKAGKAAK